MGNSHAIKGHTHYSLIKAYTQRVRFNIGRQAEQSETCRTMNSIVKRSHFDRIVSNQINHHKSKHQRVLLQVMEGQQYPCPSHTGGGRIEQCGCTMQWTPCYGSVYTV